MSDGLIVEERCLDGDVAEEEAEAHVELRSLEIDVLLPDRGGFHVLSDTLNCAFEHLLDLLVGVLAQRRMVMLQEGQIAFPEVDLGRVVAE